MRSGLMAALGAGLSIVICERVLYCCLEGFGIGIPGGVECFVVGLDWI